VKNVLDSISAKKPDSSTDKLLIISSFGKWLFW